MVTLKGFNGQFQQVGQNVHAHITDDGLLVVVMDTKANLGPSSTGKSDTVATTGGNISLGNCKVGINAYRPVDKMEAARRLAKASEAAKVSA